jgi:WXG100 family type VII secretion target
MAASQCRSDFDQLKSIAGQFNSAHETIKGMNGNIKSNSETLKRDWVGKGSDKFHAEMDGQVLPALKRLENALATATNITNQIAQIMHQAEDDVSGCWKAGGE